MKPKSLLIVCALQAWCVHAATLHVAPGGSNLAPYADWATAATSIQAAINASANGDTVLVTNGVYNENISFSGRNIAVASLFLPTGDRAHIDSTIIRGTGTGAVVRIMNGETTNALLCGFTITNGSAVSTYGGGISCTGSSARIESVKVKGNRAHGLMGAGIYLSSFKGLIRNSVIEGNRSLGAAGIAVYYSQPRLENLIVRGNTATGLACGGIYFYHSAATVRTALVVGNYSATRGGGLYFDASTVLLENLTVFGNSAGIAGGGLCPSYASHPVLVNSIVWSNAPQQVGYDSAWSGMDFTVQYSDIQGGTNGVSTFGKGPLYWQAGNLQNDPLFAGSSDFHLSAGSPCIDAGTNRAWMAAAKDLDDSARVSGSGVDMGAYEFTNTVGTMVVTTPMTPAGPSSGLASQSLTFVTGGATTSLGGGVEYRFDWGDGAMSGWLAATQAAHAWPGAGTYALRAQARSAVSQQVVSAWSGPALLAITNAPPPAPVPGTHYVAPNGGNVWPYTNWSTAATSIQAAINASLHGDTVLVTNGVYNENITFGGRNITVASLLLMSGDRSFIDSTIIRGTGTGSVVRIVNGETSAALLTGFTITNGLNTTSQGGGVFCDHVGARIENVKVKGNRATSQVGGGIALSHHTGTLKNVEVENNQAWGGAGIACMYGSPVLENVTARNNRTTAAACGGLYFYHSAATVRTALLSGNHAATRGGGIYTDACSPLLENVTMVNNSAAIAGGGVCASYSSNPRLVNCIVWSNAPQQIAFDSDWFSIAVTVEYSDVQNGAAGITTFGKGTVNWLSGNLQVDPLFDGDSYRLLSASPCVNAGTNRSWMASATDLAGNSRIAGGKVDMGAFEFVSNAVPLGSFVCMIEPEAVRLLGAMWRLTSGPHTNWLASGTALANIPAGVYTTAFKAVASWIAPSDTTVNVSAGIATTLHATYAPVLVDTVPPVLVGINPPSGYVTDSNHIGMTIIATDNVAIARVTVNGHDAEPVGGNAYAYEINGVRGSYQENEVVAYDSSGNSTTTTVVYIVIHGVHLQALWDGHWRIRNPLGATFNYQWDVVDGAESGSGILSAHSDVYFTTTSGKKTVRLYLDGVLADTQTSSHLAYPGAGADEALADSDGDGLKNRDEDHAGTDAFSDASTLALKVSEPVGLSGMQPQSLAPRDPASAGSGYSFSWDSVVGNLYSVEISLDLKNWTPVPEFTDTPGTGASFTYANDSAPELFFRISTRPAPP